MSALPTRPPRHGEYAVIDRASGYALYVPAPTAEGGGRALTGTLGDVWRATRRVGNIAIVRYEGNGDSRVIYERGC